MLLFKAWRVDTIYHIPKGERGVKINDTMLTLALTAQMRRIHVFLIGCKVKGAELFQRIKVVK
jgi:hypothetical protein